MTRRWRRATATGFVIGWILLFCYQTFRLNYINPWLRATVGRELLRIPFLFPPAGWIMFYRVDRVYGFAEIYGIRGQTAIRFDPHDIFETRSVGYDNIHHNVLVGVLDPDRAAPFCRYLNRKLPGYDAYAVVYAQYPDLITTPERVLRGVAYQCPGSTGQSAAR